MSTVAKLLIAWLHLNQLRNHEHFQAHSEINALLHESNAAALHIEDDLPGRHAAQLATLDEAIKKIVRSPNTKLIQEADKKRDEAYRGLVAYNKAMCLHIDPAIRAAARRIQIVIDTYKNVVNMSYEEETSAIYNLVQDLKSAKYAADVTLIGLMPWVNSLENANNSVSTLFSVRDGENAAKSHVNARDARADIDNTYTIIVERVNSYAKKETTPAIAEFITKINLIIKRFNTLIKQHQGHGHHHHQHGNGGQSGEDGAGTDGNDV